MTSSIFRKQQLFSQEVEQSNSTDVTYDFSFSSTNNSAQKAPQRLGFTQKLVKPIARKLVDDKKTITNNNTNIKFELARLLGAIQSYDAHCR